MGESRRERSVGATAAIWARDGTESLTYQLVPIDLFKHPREQAAVQEVQRASWTPMLQIPAHAKK